MYSKFKSDSDKEVLVTRLINHSKSGGNSAFLNLVKLFIDNIYLTSFKLTLTEDLAAKLTIASVMHTWQNIQKFNNQIPILNLIIKSVIETYYNYKIKYNVHGSDTEKINDLTDLEKEFCVLDADERIIAILYLELDYSENEILELVPQIEKKNIRAIIRRVIQYLSPHAQAGKLKDLFPEEWDQLIDLKNRGGNFNALNIFLEIRNLKNDFQLFCENLGNMFGNVETPVNIMDRVKSNMMEVLENSNHKEMDEKETIAVNEKKIRSTSTQRVKSVKSKAKKTKENTNKDNKKTSRKFSKIYLIIFLLLACGVAYAYFFLYGNSSCEIINISGVYQINGFQGNKNDLAEGDIILTAAGSQLTLDFIHHGTLMLLENSSVQILSNYRNELKVRIIKGNIACYFANLNDQFSIDEEMLIELITDVGSIKTNNSDFSISVGLTEPIRLEVTRGYVTVTDNQNSVYHLGAEYVLTQSHGKIVIPYNIKTNVQLVGILETLQSSISGDQLRSILSMASENDMLTLWHLIPRASKFDRERIFTKINEFAFMPYPEIERKAIQLDTESLNYILNLIMINYL